jgi:hypothetical protein
MPWGKERKPIFRDERDRPAQVRKYLNQCLSADRQTQRVDIGNRRLRLSTRSRPHDCRSLVTSSPDKPPTALLPDNPKTRYKPYRF